MSMFDGLDALLDLDDLDAGDVAVAADGAAAIASVAGPGSIQLPDPFAGGDGVDVEALAAQVDEMVADTVGEAQADATDPAAMDADRS